MQGKIIIIIVIKLNFTSIKDRCVIISRYAYSDVRVWLLINK